MDSRPNLRLCQASPDTQGAVSVPKHFKYLHPREQGSIGKNVVFSIFVASIPFLSLNFLMGLWMLPYCLREETPRVSAFCPIASCLPSGSPASEPVQAQKLTPSWCDSLACHYPTSDTSWLENKFLIFKSVKRSQGELSGMRKKKDKKEEKEKEEYLGL